MFHVNAKPSGGNWGNFFTVSGGTSGSFLATHPHLNRDGTQTWRVTNPQGSITLATVSTSPGSHVFLQADVVGGTYTTKRVKGGLAQTAQLKLQPWVALFSCNLTSTTRFTLTLDDLPTRKGNQDTAALSACKADGNIQWKGSPPALTVRLTPA